MHYVKFKMTKFHFKKFKINDKTTILNDNS